MAGSVRFGAMACGAPAMSSMSAIGYEETLERLSVGVRSPPESRPSDRAIQPVGDQCLVPATKRTLDVTRVYARL